MRAKNLMSIVLAGLLVFANTVCACPAESDNIADVNPHAHHQVHERSADAESAPCVHQECENCTSIAIGATPDRDGKLAGVSKAGPDDDFIWLAPESIDVRAWSPTLTRISPPMQRIDRPAETPVRRADVRLE